MGVIGVDGKIVFCEHIKNNEFSLLWFTACPPCEGGVPSPHRCMECGVDYGQGQRGKLAHYSGPPPDPRPPEPMKQGTIDGAKSPLLKHEGEFIKDKSDFIKFTASEIRSETEKAFCFVTKGDPQKWVPTSV